ncbi:MAG: hypothetical protein FWD11_10870, partial [Micrococcales bacterium]|nr:hypothetical protein [Micrococcales bacterium]
VDDFSTLVDRPPVSLLDVPDAQRDWVVLRPHTFGQVDFDPYTQTLTWLVADAAGVVVPLCVPWTTTTATLVAAVERHALELAAAGQSAAGTLVVAQVHTLGGTVVGEPLSLVRPDAPQSVESLCFASTGPVDHDHGPVLDTPSAVVRLPSALVDLQDWLTRAGERGTGASTPGPLLAELSALTAAVRQLGLEVFEEPVGDVPVAEQVLRTSYLVCQVRLLLGASQD